ncbi:MAG: hypothetical protein WBO36_07940, partial [Saprospiraceae bacterium]
IYVLTGDGNKSGIGGCFEGEACFNYGAVSNGVYKSSNGGNSWIRVSSFSSHLDSIDYFGRNIIINPTDPNVLYAATSKGLYKTIDTGNNWVLKTDTVNIWDVVFKPNSPDSVYCVGDNFLQKTNAAGNFMNVNVDSLSLADRVSIAVTPANPNKIVLFAGNDAQNSCVGVFVSNNSGTNFTRYASSTGGQFNLFHNYIDADVTLAQQDYNNTVAISPSNENVILVGGLCVWSSQNGGVDWQQETAYGYSSNILHEYIHPDQHHLIYHPNGKLYVSNDGGVYVSEDDGDDWDFIETGLSITQFYHFEWENDEGNPWGGTQDNGILERFNYYEYRVYSGGDGYDVMTDHPWRASDGDSDDVYFSANEKIKKDGFAWGGIIDISVPNNTDFFANLAMKPDEEDYIYAGYQKSTYRSPNAGGTWITMPDSIPGNWSIATGSNHPYRIYTSGYNTHWDTSRIFRNDWPTSVDITNGLLAQGYKRNKKITDIEVDELNDDILYVSCGGINDTTKVFMSTDAGSTWTNLTFNLPKVPVFCIKKDELDGLYIGTSIGVYYKQASNNYWEPFYNELPPVPITQIEIEGQFVHCSTFGRGLWTTKK